MYVLLDGSLLNGFILRLFFQVDIGHSTATTRGGSELWRRISPKATSEVDSLLGILSILQMSSKPKMPLN